MSSLFAVARTAPGGMAEVPAQRPVLDLARYTGAAAWASLPSSMRVRFEHHRGPARYRGAITLECSRIGALFARLVKPLGAPLPAVRGRSFPATVRVHAEGGGVVWERWLGGCKVRSVKAPGRDGTLEERTDGGLGMRLAVSVQDGALVFESLSYFLSIGRWRVPVPGLLTPGRCRVEHRAIGAYQFRFTMTMTHWLWGETFRQCGDFYDMPEYGS